MRIWFLEYSHKHGTDHSVFSSYESALGAAATIANDWAKELLDAEIAAQVLEAYVDGRHLDAVTLFRDHQDHEQLEIHELEFKQAVRGANLVDIKTDMVHTLMDSPMGNLAGETACKRLFFWPGTDVAFPVGSTNFIAHIPPEVRPLTCLECIAADVRPLP